ncbi:MAG: iron-containing alcohol dehydrogenase [Armatimonadetes bacterium]|nr:iron-containing alcohol dehydrogenase [Armatimonadota bacterium]
MSFEITSPATIHCGAGRFNIIADEAAGLGKRAAIVTGSHLAGSARLSRLCEALHKNGVRTSISEPVTDEPAVERVDEMAAFLRDERSDLVISIGGGSVMDTAKAAAVMAVNDGITEDYQLKKREITNPPLPQIAVPTTAGTGSESTRVSVLTNNSLAIKRSISHPQMTPAVAVLDPELTVDLDLYFTTLTAMDAFAHAIESAVSLAATPYTRHIALAAIEHLSAGLPVCQQYPDDLDARLNCLLGSCFAGLAMQNGLGASHSLAPAVCIVGKIRHSEAITALLPQVIKLNKQERPDAYDEVSRAMGTQDAAERIIELCNSGAVSASLSSYGLKASDEDDVIAALNRYGSHRQTNPVEVTDNFARRLFAAGLSGK